MAVEGAAVMLEAVVFRACKGSTRFEEGGEADELVIWTEQNCLVYVCSKIVRGLAEKEEEEDDVEQRMCCHSNSARSKAAGDAHLLYDPPAGPLYYAGALFTRGGVPGGCK